MKKGTHEISKRIYFFDEKRKRLIARFAPADRYGCREAERIQTVLSDENRRSQKTARTQEQI
jgi:hypothetical protein